MTSRKELKEQFSKGKLLGEEDFARLIDACLNKEDDGILITDQGIRFLKAVQLDVDSNDLKVEQDGERVKVTDGNVVFTGLVDFQKEIQAGNSDIYFTKTDHQHTGKGNADGHAAIENSENYKALMILGRMIKGSNRKIGMWDHVTVNGELDVTGAISAKNSDIYFTNTKHVHTGRGNAEGNAAIENSENYSALMILGRMVKGSNRKIGMWDHVTVHGEFEATGSINAKNSDIYFTNTKHTHTGKGNTVGYAAIENSENYNTLMILGRQAKGSNRKVGIWDHLTVNGDLDVTRTLKVAGKVVQSSSERYKKNVEVMKEDFSKILSLQSKSYELKEDNKGEKHFGFIAEELHENGLEYLVQYNDDGKPDGIQYDRVAVILNEVVKEQHQQISSLEKRLDALEKRLDG